MRISKLILYTGVCCFYLGLTGPNAKQQIEAAEIHTISGSSEKIFVRPRLLVAADSSDDKQANDTQKASENQSTTKAEKIAPTETTSPEENTDTLTPFEPTEKVKADQAVDFPYDI